MDDAAGDVGRHQRAWNGFVRFTTISIAAVVITLAAMAIFLL